MNKTIPLYFADDWISGMSYDEMSSKYNRCDDTFRIWARKLGIYEKRQVNKPEPKKHRPPFKRVWVIPDGFADDYISGMTYRDMCEKYKRSDTTLSEWAKALGIRYKRQKPKPVKKANRCKSCVYGAALCSSGSENELWYCNYICITNHRRPCKGGPECTAYEERTTENQIGELHSLYQKEYQGHEFDAEHARRLNQ